MFVVRDEAALGIGDVIRQAAGLTAVTSIGAATGVGMADETLATVCHAQSTVHKKL
jgi:hypothetical protein